MYKQILGDISKQEVKEVNSVLGSRYYFTKCKSQPASMYAWDTYLAATWGLGAACAFFGFFVKKYSILWLALPFAPCWVHIAYNYRHQPLQDLENGYRYTIQKRAASVQYEKNRSKVDSAFSKFAKQKDDLKNYLTEHGMTLYDLEADVYDKISNGTMK